ncbi:MAG: hypothetical protein U9R75_11580, partial [Candidatus Thermoplasmatota archaeon]|nr:hypothetical protein [Candidatus Thermoplasmatota archaeon]
PFPCKVRGRENGHILNTTRIYIDPGGSATFNLNVTIGSVIFHLWAEIISDGWQPNVKSIDELILIGSPEVELMPSISCESFTVDQDIGFQYIISLSGGISNITDTLVKFAPYAFEIEISDTAGNLLWRNLSWFNLSANSTVMTYRLNSGRLDIGDHVLSALVIPPYQDHREGIRTYRFTSMISIVPRTDLEILELCEDTDGSVRGMNINVSNHGSEEVDIYHLTLFNGLPEDEIVISRNIGLSLGAGEEAVILLPEDLPVGTYLLSVVISVPVIGPSHEGMSWMEMDRKVVEVDIVEQVQGQIQENREMDWDDVTYATIFSLSAVFAVLLVSSLFFRKERKED